MENHLKQISKTSIDDMFDLKEAKMSNKNKPTQQQYYTQGVIKEKIGWDEDDQMRLETLNQFPEEKKFKLKGQTMISTEILDAKKKPSSGEFTKFSRNSKDSLISEEVLKDKMSNQILQLCSDPFNCEDFVISDCYITFSFSKFLKFFLYHFVYFFTFGPLLGPLFVLIENKNFIMNMGFLGFNVGSMFQIGHWAFMVSCLSLFFLQNDNNYLTSTELGMAVLVTLLRCLIVAIRYGTTTPSRLQSQYKKIFTGEENNNEFLGAGWRDITPFSIDKEIRYSMIRNEIENCTFTIKFITKMNQEYSGRFSNYSHYKQFPHNFQKEEKHLKMFLKVLTQAQSQRTLRDSQSNKVTSILPQGLDFTYLETPTKEELYRIFPCRLVMKEIILCSRVMEQGVHKNVLRLVSVIHAFIPFILNLISDLSSDDDSRKLKYSSGVFWYYTLSLATINFVIYYINLIFIEIGVIDMKRKLFWMKVLNSVLEPNRFKLKKWYQVFPLQNYFDPKSTMSWLDMRILFLDIGKRFTIRIEMYATVYLVIYAIISGLYLAWFFGIFHYQFEEATYVIAAFEILNFLLMFYAMFKAASKINDSTNQQLLRISEIRTVLERLVLDWKEIVHCKQINSNSILNNTFNNAFLYFQHIIEDEGEKAFKQIIKKQMKVLEVIQQRLEKERDTNPITILGIPVTPTLMSALETSILSLGFAMVQKKTNILG